MSKAPLNLYKPDRTINVGVVLMGSETEILDVAPVDMFYALSKNLIEDWPEAIMDPKLKKEAHDMDFFWVNETGKNGKLTGGLTIQPTHDFKSAPVLDIVIMGAHGVTYQPNEAELAYVRKAYEESTAFITICGGIQAPLLAGVLKGKSATGPRPLLPMAKLQAPDTEWHEKRWHRDGKLWTSGALLNGLDLMAAFVKEYWGGPGTLVEFMLELGHYPIRDVNYADAPSKR